ncbi:MAG: hypothetical protein ACE5GF_00395 [Thermodesulfobacteriota bacterium]
MKIAFDSQGHEVHEGSMLVPSDVGGRATVRVFKISGTHITLKDSGTFEETLMTKEEFKNSTWILADKSEG